MRELKVKLCGFITLHALTYYALRSLSVKVGITMSCMAFIIRLNNIAHVKL